MTDADAPPAPDAEGRLSCDDCGDEVRRLQADRRDSDTAAWLCQACHPDWDPTLGPGDVEVGP